MATSTETTLPPATLSSIIDQARECGTPRKAFAIAADASEEMVRRWEGRQLPKLRPFKRLISRNNILPDVVRQQCVDWFLRGTGWRAVPCEGFGCEVLDANGDGKVNGHDTLVFQIRGLGEAGKAMEMLEEALRAGQLSESEKAELRSVLHTHRECVQHAIETLNFEKGLRVAR